MKKIFITLILGLIVIVSQSQPYTTLSNGQSGSSVRTTLNNLLTWENNLGLDLEFSADASSWHYPWASGDLYIRYSDDFGSTWSDAIYLWDGAKLGFFNTDTLVLSGDTITDFTLAAWDSLAYTSNNYLQWWNQGTALDSVLIDIPNTMVYELTLPIAGTLSGSVALMVEGTDYPTGWTIAASGGDLEVNHALGRYAANVNVFYNTTGTSYRQLVNFNNAYSGVLNEDVNNVNIESISSFYTAYKLKVFIIFE